MRERLTEILASIRAFWDRASKKARIIFFSCLAGVLIVALALILLFNHTNYVLLYNGLSASEGASVLAILGEMGINPEISNTGAIYVPEEDINRARMQVATNGFTGGNFTYDIYKEAPLTATQADKNQWYINSIQNRLQETIQTFDEVQQAVVTVSVPQPSIYALQQETLPPSAAIKITKRPGQTLTPEQIQGILNIVKDSVAGLSEENISLSDETGDIKSYIESQRGASTSKLNLTEEVNRSVRQKIMTMLQPVFGNDNIQVAVNSVLDTDSKITERTEYIPYDESNPQNNPLDYAEYERDKLGGEAGPAEGVPGANDNVDVPQYTARDVDVNDADSYSVRDVYDYLVTSVRDQITKEGFEIRDMNVAVVVNSTNMPDSQRDQIIDLVSRASGVASDKISVQNMQFQGLPGVDLELEEPDWTQLLLITVIGTVALLIILTIVIMHMRKKRREAQLAAEMEELALAEEMSLAELMNSGEDYEPIQLQETQEHKLKSQIRDLAESDPEIVAQLIKTWLVQAE